MEGGNRSEKKKTGKVRRTKLVRKREKESNVMFCKSCQKQFHKVGDVESHMANHRIKNPKICDVCKGKFATDADYELHLVLDPNTKKLKCDSGLKKKKDLRMKEDEAADFKKVNQPNQVDSVSS